jgi:hypothetical protein
MTHIQFQCKRKIEGTKSYATTRIIVSIVTIIFVNYLEPGKIKRTNFN